MNNWEAALGFEEPSNPVPLVDQSIPVTGNFKRQEALALAEKSLDFLASLAIPDIIRYNFPPVYLSIWAWLQSFVHQERTFPQLALGFPRGFAKTTFVKFWILFVILFTKKKFILVCARSQRKAEAITADVTLFLSSHNIIKLFGDWRTGILTDNQETKKFGFRGRNISLVAGTVETVRGLNLQNERPDIIIFDDIQTRVDADSEVVSKQIETDMVGTAMKAKSPHGCMFIFVGNMYPTKHSILRHLKDNPNWLKFIVGGILADGTSLWEDLQPIEQLLKEYLNDIKMGHPEIFHAEVLNDDQASVNNIIDLSKLPSYQIPDTEPHQGNFIVIDPATDKPGADAVSIMYFEIYDSKPVCKHLVEGNFSPGDTIVTALKIALVKNCKVVGIEGTAYQSTLCYWFNFICNQYQIFGIHAVELPSGRNSKNSRIIVMFKALLAGELFIHPLCQAAISLQILSFNPLKTNNTDGLLDCLAYAHKMIELYGDLIIGGLYLVMQETAKIEIWDPALNSPF